MLKVSRTKLLECFVTMDNEAFSWLVMCISGDRQPQIWPDGTGGFRDKEIIEKAKLAAKKWIKDYQNA